MTRQTITPELVQRAQEEWAQSIVAIGEAHQHGVETSSLAGAIIDNLYAYGLCEVLFKPTKAAQQQFRPTREDALSYFVGGAIAEDLGFALQPWSKVRFENHAISVHGESAFAQGNYFFTDANTGGEIKVEYTLGYAADGQGKLRIFLHHSSLPYQPA